MALAPAPSPPVSREAFAALKARLSGTTLASPPNLLANLIPTAVPALDRLLGGGLPTGTLIAFEGSAGRWSLSARLVAQATCRGLVAIIDDGSLYPPSLAKAGARLDRVLVVRARTTLAVARAADILLRSRACCLILMPAIALRDAIWVRLARLAHRMGVLLVAICARVGAPFTSSVALRLRCTRERLVVHGMRGLWCAFGGYTVRVEVRKNFKHLVGAHMQVRAVEDLDGAPVRERDIIGREDLADAALR